jgi:hypothetical protein
MKSKKGKDVTNFCCYGFGLWAWGVPSPMGSMDARDGMPTIKCPVCGANKNPRKLEPKKKKTKRKAL